jgi:hypothetical protein
MKIIKTSNSSYFYRAPLLLAWHRAPAPGTGLRAITSFLILRRVHGGRRWKLGRGDENFNNRHPDRLMDHGSTMRKPTWHWALLFNLRCRASSRTIGIRTREGIFLIDWSLCGAPAASCLMRSHRSSTALSCSASCAGITTSSACSCPMREGIVLIDWSDCVVPAASCLACSWRSSTASSR